jgi:hypothetical protein
MTVTVPGQLKVIALSLHPDGDVADAVPCVEIA